MSHTILTSSARALVSRRASLAPTEPVAMAISACRAIARAEMGYGRLSPTLAREVDALVLAARGVPSVAIASVVAPSVTTVRLSDEDRAAVVAAFIWFVKMMTALVQALAGRRVVDMPEAPAPAVGASCSSWQAPAFPARQDSAIVVRSN